MKHYYTFNSIRAAELWIKENCGLDGEDLKTRLNKWIKSGAIIIKEKK